MIPNDCLIVKPKKDVSPFTHLTWNSNGCPKTIPFDIYELNKHRLDVVEDPNNFIHDFKEPDKEPEKETPVKSTFERPKEPKVDIEKEVKDVIDEAMDLAKKVKASGKGKNKKR